MRPPYDPWEGGSRPGLLDTFCRGFCSSICSCLYFFSCCWLLQDCLPGLGRPGYYDNPPGSYAPSSGLPFGHSHDHHHRLTDPLVGRGPAPPRFGPPPPYVPGPLAGPPGEDPMMFDPPGPPLPPGPPRY
ncbi:hypothetical protein AgCh_032537 [Apium graveolens]